jgi:hypothetical protein
LGLFRRERPIHEQLAEEAGLDIDGVGDELALGAEDEESSGRISVADLLVGPRVASDLLAVHGIPREREWDAVASAEAQDLPGDELEFVALPDGSLVVDDDLPDGALTPLADALEGQIRAPYHGYALRQEEDVWSVAARRTQIVELEDDVPGDEVDVAVNDGSRATAIDGAESALSVPGLEAFAAQQYGSFVLHASRLDDTLWEVTVLPL